MKGLLFGGAGTASALADLGLLILRLFAGLALAFGHGINKIPPSGRFIEGVASFGFPVPTLFAWAAGLSELVGGCLVAIGLMTRPAAFFAFCTMMVAVFFAHADDPFGRKELPLLFGMVMVFLMTAGAGRFAIDSLIGGRRR